MVSALSKQIKDQSTESSKCSCNRFFQKWAGRSVWYDRRVRNAEAAGSNPARSTFAPARLRFETPQTLEVALYLKKKSLAEPRRNYSMSAQE